jgi:hypothetical protein
VPTTIPLRSANEFRTWTTYLTDRTKRSYRYNWKASFIDGEFVEQGWTDNPGDPVLPVRLDRPGVDITVIADTLDLTTCPLTEVALRWDGLPETTTLVFRDTAPQRWHVPAPLGTPVSYAWQVTHHPPDRDPVVLEERHETDEVVVLPAYRAATAGELVVIVLGQLVAWADTPIVGVDLAYADLSNGLEASTSLTLTREAPTQTWRLATRDARITGYRSRITWVRADGSSHEGAWVTQILPRIVVATLQADTP